MEIKIRKIGNSLGILLPKDTLKLYELKEGDPILLSPKDKEMNLTLRKVI